MSVILACGPERGGTEGTGSMTSGATGSTDTTSPGTTSSTGEASTGEPSTGAASTGEPTTGEPICIDFFMSDHDRENELTPALFTCGLPELCAGPKPLAFTEDFNSVTTEDIERGRCMVRAMRDRTPGLFRFTVFPRLGYDTTTIEILDERILVRQHVLEDFSEYYRERGRRLFAPEKYADCVAGPAAQVLECLTERYEPACVSEPLMCPP